MTRRQKTNQRAPRGAPRRRARRVPNQAQQQPLPNGSRPRRRGRPGRPGLPRQISPSALFMLPALKAHTDHPNRRTIAVKVRCNAALDPYNTINAGYTNVSADASVIVFAPTASHTDGLFTVKLDQPVVNVDNSAGWNAKVSYPAVSTWGDASRVVAAALRICATSAPLNTSGLLIFVTLPVQPGNHSINDVIGQLLNHPRARRVPIASLIDNPLTVNCGRLSETLADMYGESYGAYGEPPHMDGPGNPANMRDCFAFEQIWMLATGCSTDTRLEVSTVAHREVIPTADFAHLGTVGPRIKGNRHPVANVAPVTSGAHDLGVDAGLLGAGAAATRALPAARGALGATKIGRAHV